MLSERAWCEIIKNNFQDIFCTSFYAVVLSIRSKCHCHSFNSALSPGTTQIYQMGS